MRYRNTKHAKASLDVRAVLLSLFAILKSTRLLAAVLLPLGAWESQLQAEDTRAWCDVLRPLPGGHAA